MSTFTDLDWQRIDVCGIVTFGGLAAIDERRHSACRNWLLREGWVDFMIVGVRCGKCGRLGHCTGMELNGSEDNFKQV